jgi:outer membrane protein OmpA-like peptidoglycan-associated protein
MVKATLSFLCFIIVLPILLSGVTRGQNLVPNPGFEKYNTCPEYYTQWSTTSFVRKLVPGWTYPTWGTPDYFNRCANNIDCAVPENSNGISESHSGDGYVGFFLKPTTGKAGRGYVEYLDARLNKRLEKGKKYCISLHFKLSTYSYYAVDNMGIYLTGSRVQENSPAQLSFDAQVKNEDKEFMTNKEEWKELCGTYIANGAEEYIIIGNFEDGKVDYIVADTSKIPPRTYKYAYYYIDDVSVRALENCLECSCVPHDLDVDVTETSFTGNMEQENDGSIRINISGGTEPYDIIWSNGKTGLSVSGLGEGTHFYTVRDANNCIATDTIRFTGPLRVHSSSEYKGDCTGWIKLDVKGGVPPYNYSWSNGSTQQDLSGLCTGEYVYRVKDKAGNTATGKEMFDEFTGEISNVKEGEALVLENIYFDFDKIDLLPKSFLELNKVVGYMQKYDIREVEISGHTDSKGSDEYNQKLSEARAKSVVEYLIFKGIAKERLAYTGHGEAQPIATNETDEGRAENRRVEFKLKRK